MFADKFLTKESLDECLRQLGKEYRKLNGNKMHAELVLIGGASVVINYGFREMTYDIDAIINAGGAMKQAINNIGDKFSLPNSWLNSDFVRTSSYSAKLVQFSKYYRTFSNVLEVRTVNREYLVAMKLMSGRQYKNDISDILGILNEEKQRGVGITLNQIKNAVCDLYGEWEKLPETSRKFIKTTCMRDDFEIMYESWIKEEKKNKDILANFNEQHKKITNEDNVDEILRVLQKKHDM